MGVDAYFSEWFPDQKLNINNFYIDDPDWNHNSIEAAFGTFKKFNIKVEYLINKLFNGDVPEEEYFSEHYPNDWGGRLTLEELKELYELLERIINYRTFKERYLFMVGDNHYPYLSINYSSQGEYLELREDNIENFPKFILDFLNLCIKNNSGLKYRVSY